MELSQHERAGRLRVAGRRRGGACFLLWWVAAIVAVAAHVHAPSDGLAAPYLLVSGGAATAAWLGARRDHPEQRAHRLLAAGVVLSFSGDLTERLTMLGGTAPALSVADVGWLGAYAALAAALLTKLRAASPRRIDRDGLIDMVAIGVVVLLLEWELAVAATVGDGDLPLMVRSVWALYPALDALVIVLVVRLVMTRRHLSTGVALITLGATAWFAADLAYLVLGSADSYSAWLDAGWLVGALLLASATWQRPVRRPLAAAAGDAPLGVARVALAFAPLLLPVSMIAVEHLRGGGGSPVPEVLATVLLAGTAFARAVRLLGAAAATRAQMRSQARYANALAANSADAVVIVGADGRVLHDASGFAALIGAGDVPTVGMDPLTLAEPTERAGLLAVFQRVLASPGGVFEMELKVRSPQAGCDLWLGLRLKNLLGDPDVAGVVINVSDITDRKRAEEALYHQAFHDALTGLPNRALFLDRLEHACSRRSRHAGRPAVVYLDLDGFKDVNDSLGHAQGDRLLRVVARRLTGAVRSGDTVARLGGDEFAILIEDSQRPVDEAETVALRVLQALSTPIVLDGQPLAVSASVGIATAAGSATATSLLRDADIAMYRAKSTGRARAVMFDEQMLVTAMERITLETDLATALEQRELRLAYQPVVDLRSGVIAGMEALLRWEHPRLGMIGPARFVPVAESTGMIVPIGGWALREACRTAASWRRQYPVEPDLSMAVNISARQLASDGLLEQVRRALADSGLPPACLVLEMTETALIADPTAAAARLGELRALGVRIAIDDFGTGYSSLSYLRQFPVDILKIDRSFVDTIGDEPQVPPIVRGLLELGRTLGLEVIAEGVERPLQRDRLREEGCRLAQGYLFARPLDATDAELLLVRMASGAGDASLPSWTASP